MPELPEVETVRRGLAQTIIGKTVMAVEVRAPKIFADVDNVIESKLIGATITTVARRAKILLIGLSNGWTLAVHLKMTGQLVVKQPEITKPKIQTSNKPQTSNSKTEKNDLAEFTGGHPEKAYDQPLPHKHTHVIVTFTDGTKLYYNDLRKFGWMRLLSDNRKFQIPNPKSQTQSKIQNPNFLTVEGFIDSLGLGPEPLEAEFTVEYFVRLLAKRVIPIKQLLLEQKGIAGIGNIYADEALFYAGIHPQRRANSLGEDEIEKLFTGIQHVLRLGVEHGGTTMSDYRNVDGEQGRMREHLKVYGREGEACFICGTAIERMKIGQRSSHYCPTCQKKG